MLKQNLPNMSGPVCPLPIRHYASIVMGHGSGGRMTHDLIHNYFLPHFCNPALLAGNDFAEIENINPNRIVMSTDMHIVSPLFFPGGDIGRLSIAGTINDVCMSGAIPLAITAGFILEEGLSTEVLEKVILSMANTAEEAGIPIIAGDTKVVEKGKGDGLFIATTGVGIVPENVHIGGSNAQPGDAVLVSGTLGDHGIAVLCARGELGFTSQISSDVAPLNGMIQEILAVTGSIHVLRDPTRGGVATTLNEIAVQSKLNILLDENRIPVNPAVKSACEMLGFDPLYVANEGKVIIILPQQDVEVVLAVLHKHVYGKNATLIGSVQTEPANRVLMRTSIGGTRLLDVMAGEMLPRIC